MEASVLAEFEALGPPVKAIHGNVDSAELRSRLPDHLSLEIESVRLGVVHDSGQEKGRPRGAAHPSSRWDARSSKVPTSASS